jgi:hypothetical protein
MPKDYVPYVLIHVCNYVLYSQTAVGTGGNSERDSSLRWFSSRSILSNQCCGSASRWCGSGSYHLLFSRFGTSNSPKWPSKASTFSLRCGSGSCFFTLVRIRIQLPKIIRIHADPDPQYWNKCQIRAKKFSYFCRKLVVIGQAVFI